MKWVETMIGRYIQREWRYTLYKDALFRWKAKEKNNREYPADKFNNLKTIKKMKLIIPKDTSCRWGGAHCWWARPYQPRRDDVRQCYGLLWRNFCFCTSHNQQSISRRNSLHSSPQPSSCRGSRCHGDNYGLQSNNIRCLWCYGYVSLRTRLCYLCQSKTITGSKLSALTQGQ